ncbi:unnamed protein product [Rhizophagus irregularis]|uniref:Uncharacterized protein n=1 Tax=Rhizophagus irregularis TaxID=588596 RepID=A0A2N1M4N8_9GLOM|nr:hypothetical protein RhiirC2_721747 [Rhizophagus irregularis]CAB4395260.1 unnamed protein product [Rhizophagus irregularis]CAB4397195.1 unnamed protein product [Rhizophagus irregularis]
MIQYLRLDATHLSAEDIQDIIKAKNSMKQASEAIANKYKILTRWVYQIWRGTHPPLDSKDIKLISEEPGKKDGPKGRNPSSSPFSISEPTINQNQPIPGTKKEIISLTESSEDVLDLYKRTDNTLEEIKASGHPLISK